MGFKTVLLLAVISVAVVNSFVTNPYFNPMFNGFQGTSEVDANVVSSDFFLKKAQEIAAAKVNKGFEMKKEGMKIAQQAMLNKFAMMGADEKMKPTTVTPNVKITTTSATSKVVFDSESFEEKTNEEY